MNIGFKIIRRTIIPQIRESGLMLKLGLAIVATIIVLSIAAPLLTPYSPVTKAGVALQPPSSRHIMGTNNLGYDVFSRILYGGRTVLTVVISATLLSMCVGVPLGLISGYYGRIVDRIFSIVMDSMYAFPSLILALAIAAVLGPSMVNAIIAIAVVYIPTYFRMVRGQTLSIKSLLYVEAAKAIGAKDLRIIIRHILPNLLPTVIVVFTMNIADAILTEAGLSFLGFSVPPPTPDWGADLRAGHEYLLAGYWWLVAFPGLMIMLLATGFALIGEGLNDLLSLREAEKR